MRILLAFALLANPAFAVGPSDFLGVSQPSPDDFYCIPGQAMFHVGDDTDHDHVAVDEFTTIPPLAGTAGLAVSPASFGAPGNPYDTGHSWLVVTYRSGCVPCKAAIRQLAEISTINPSFMRWVSVLDAKATPEKAAWLGVDLTTPSPTLLSVNSRGEVERRHEGVFGSAREMWDWAYRGQVPYPSLASTTPSTAFSGVCPCPNDGPCPCPAGDCPCPEECPGHKPTTTPRNQNGIRYSGGPTWGTNFVIEGKRAQSQSRDAVLSHMVNAHNADPSWACANGDGYVSKQEGIRWLGYDHAQRLSGNHSPRHLSGTRIVSAPRKARRSSGGRRFVFSRRSCPSGRCP